MIIQRKCKPGVYTQMSSRATQVTLSKVDQVWDSERPDWKLKKGSWLLTCEGNEEMRESGFSHAGSAI